MKFPATFPLTLALLTAASASMAQKPAPAQHDGGTTIVLRQAYGVGEVIVDDPRILDLSGQYTFATTTMSVALRVVQDGRGRLVGNYTVTRDGHTTGPFPAVGSLAVRPRGPLHFELAGRPPLHGGDGSTTVPPPTTYPPDTQEQHLTSATLALHVRGVYDGTAFRTRVRLQTPGGPAVLHRPLHPRNPRRGAVVADSHAFQPHPGTLVSTRTVTLPWGEKRFGAVERTYRRTSHFAVGGPHRHKAHGTLAPPPPFGMRLHGASTSAGDFHVFLDHLRLGYGHLDSTTATAVAKTAFPPINIPPPAEP